MYDDKQQVLEFQMTQHGKRMYAKGLFKPEYYSFSDDGVIYDSNYAFFEEDINDAEDRILNYTPVLEVVSNKSGVETSFKELKQVVEDDEELFSDQYQDEIERTYDSINSLGNSDLTNEYAPSWDLRFHSGLIENVVQVITGSAANIKIPQINLIDTKYDISVIKELPEEVRDELSLLGIHPALINSTQLFGDNTMVEIVPSDLILEVDETNTVFRNSNFDLEVFLLESKDITVVSGGVPVTEKKDILVPLFFKDKPVEFDDIYDENNFKDGDIDLSLKLDEVSYYLDIQVDDEIPDEVICRHISQDKRRGLYGKQFNCDEPRTYVLESGLYDTTLEEPGDCND